MEMEKKSYEELSNLISSCPEPLTLWEHYKGCKYTVLGAAILEYSQEPMVLYASIQYPTVQMVRPLKEWMEKILLDDDNGRGVLVPRYKQILKT